MLNRSFFLSSPDYSSELGFSFTLSAVKFTLLGVRR